MLKVFADSESPMVFTTESIHAVLGFTFKCMGNAVLSDGETPKEVVFSHPNGEPVKFVFAEGESLGRPDPGVHVPMDERLQMVDAEGWATAHDSVYWDLYMEDGRVRRYVATDMNGERGRFVSETDPHGRVVTPEGNEGSELIDTVKLIQVRQAKLGRTNSGRSYIVKKSTCELDGKPCKG